MHDQKGVFYEHFARGRDLSQAFATLEKVCKALLVEGALDKLSLLLNINQPQDVTDFGLEVLNMLVEAGKLNF